jgi:hypothetical protein
MFSSDRMQQEKTAARKNGSGALQNFETMAVTAPRASNLGRYSGAQRCD